MSYFCSKCGKEVFSIPTSDKTMLKLHKATGIAFKGPICSACVQGFGNVHKKRGIERKIKTITAYEVAEVAKTSDYYAYEAFAQKLDDDFNGVEERIKEHIKQINILTDVRNSVFNQRQLFRKLSEETENGAYFIRRRDADLFIKKKAVRLQVFMADGHKCRICGSETDLSVDHITSVFHGGGNDLLNLQTLCRSCNSSKGSK